MLDQDLLGAGHVDEETFRLATDLLDDVIKRPGVMLVIFDGVTETPMLHSLDSNKDVDVAKFGKTLKDACVTVLP